LIDGHPLRLMLLSKEKQNLLKIDPAPNIHVFCAGFSLMAIR
jgi:hypothetical protein